MELKINREVIELRETIYNGAQEQSVELDYVLPDYYPEIFRILQTRTEPKILSRQINGTTLSYELCVTIEVLYCGEAGMSAVQCLRQKLSYRKTVDLGRSCEDAVITLCPKADYINCRAVNPRRIDLRGAVSTRIHITGQQSCEAVSDLCGCHIQTKKIPVEYAAKTTHCSQIVTLSETVELGSAKPAAQSILRADAKLIHGDSKVISGKLAAKGEVHVSVLYSCDGSIEPMQFSVPFSKILDPEGLDEGCTCLLRGEVISCDITASANNDGEARALQCDLSIRLFCTAVHAAHTALVTDAFSTRHPAGVTTSELILPQLPSPISETGTAQCVMQSGSPLGQIFDVWCVPRSIGTRLIAEEGCAEASGMLRFCALAKAEDDAPVFIEQEAPFSHKISVPEGCTEIDLDAEVSSCTYTMTANDAVNIQTELCFRGQCSTAIRLSPVTDVTIDTAQTLVPSDDCALKLYFGHEGESVWEIAKKYCTAVSAIGEENELSADVLQKDEMLLIPLIG